MTTESVPRDPAHPVAPASSPHRRALLGALAGFAAAGLATRFGAEDGEAKKRRRRGNRCRSPKQVCDGRCTDTRADPRNCGGCGQSCGPGEACGDGFCVLVSDLSGITDRLVGPRGVALIAGGRLAVADADVDHLEHFVPGASDHRTVGRTGGGDGDFVRPSGIAAANEHVFVVDTGNHRIQRFDAATFAHQLSWGFFGSGVEQFRDPEGIAVELLRPGLGRVYLADTGNHQIKVYTLNGAFIDRIGAPGSGDGKFREPSDVAVARIGGVRRVVVADRGNHRIQVLDENLRFLAAFGREGSGPGEFLGPQGVSLSPDGSLFVTDGGNHRVQQFAADGAFLRVFDGAGSAVGGLRAPTGIAVGRDGAVHVCDTGNGRLVRFRPPSADQAPAPSGSARGGNAG